MAEKVTIQDIADALGVSRNTVSKAINNTGLLAEDTRERVLKKAIEMGYKQFSYMNPKDVEKVRLESAARGAVGEIALLTRGYLGNSSYISVMLDQFQSEFSKWGYSFTIHWVRDEDVRELRLPVSFDRERVSGLLSIELLDSGYYSMLCELGIPMVCVDSPVKEFEGAMPVDVINPDNWVSIVSLVKEMVGRGKKRIGFIGEYLHCQSFNERFMGYRSAMYMMGLPCLEEYCIVGNKEGVKNPSAEEYQEYLEENLASLAVMPEVFLCANDYVALDVLRVFKKLGISVPQDVWLCGFDDTAESQIITPTLTTVHVHSRTMGSCAVELLLSRMKEPSLHFRTVRVETRLVYGESTED